MSDVKPIVVGVNGTPSGISATRWAAGLAAKLGAPLTILVAQPAVRVLYSDADAALLAAAVAAHREQAPQIAAAAADAAHDAHPQLPVTTVLSDDQPDVALTAASRDARLVVVASTELSTAGALLVGSTTLRVIADTHCPVLAWRGDTVEPSTGAIVVGVDNSDSHVEVLATAFELADALAAPVVAVRSWDENLPVGDATISLLIDWKSMEEQHLKHLVEDVAPFRSRHPHVEVTCLSEPAKPSRALLDHAADALMIVVGSRRRNVLLRMVLGSTSLNVLHHAQIPVLVCPDSEHRR